MLVVLRVIDNFNLNEVSLTRISDNDLIGAIFMFFHRDLSIFAYKWSTLLNALSIFIKYAYVNLVWSSVVEL